MLSDAGGQLTVLRSSIVGNGSVGANGGGISADGATVTIRGSLISGNASLLRLWRHIRAVIVRSSLKTASSATIVVLAATIYGWGICANRGTVTIARSTISGNELGTSAGGGIALNTASNTSITDSTIANNLARRGSGGGGGGVRYTVAHSRLHNSTITGNLFVRRLRRRRRRYCCRLARARLDIANSIVAGNRSEATDGSAGTNPDIAGPITMSNGHNVFGSDCPGQRPGRPPEHRRPPPSSPRSTPPPAAARSAPKATSGPEEQPRQPRTLRRRPDQRRRPCPARRRRARRRPAACPTSARPRSTSRSRPGPPSTMTCITGTNAVNNLYRHGRQRPSPRAWAATTFMDGGHGSDVLDGGPGNDTLTGRHRPRSGSPIPALPG